VSALVAILILLLLAGVILIVAAPLRGGGGPAAGSPADASADSAAAAERHRREVARGAGREQLEAAREAKYREIRDSELDYRTGKLSQEDYAAIDAQLRGEAIEILNQLQRLEETGERELAEPPADAPDAYLDAPDA
jgi:hypothetical protein